MIELDDVREAADRIVGVAHRTPVMASRSVDEHTGASVFFKCENLQRAGSFKIRGAYNRISRLTTEERRRGVVAFSSGNHAQAVGLAAGLVGTSAVIAMPNDAPTVKRAATEQYGAEIVEYDRTGQDNDEREAIAARIADEQGRTVIPPYEHPVVMAGQGTAALELIDDAGELDVLVVPIGGGGLIAGCATAASALCPEARVVGVEPAAGDDTRRSLAAGERVRIDVPDTIADGLGATVPGEQTFAINRTLIDEVVTVSDAQLVGAMSFLLERMKLLTEPSGAAAAAALLSGRIEAEDRRVGVILSGGNVGMKRLSRLLA